MPTNNFKLFDQNKANLLSDTEYVNATQRLNGVQTGVASSQLQNKFAYQVSLVAYAIAQIMNQNGLDASDTLAVSAFVGNLGGSLLQKVADKATDKMISDGKDNTHWVTPLLLKKAFDIYSNTAILNVHCLTGDVVTLTKGDIVLTATAYNGLAVLYPSKLGDWTIKVGDMPAEVIEIKVIGIIDYVAYIFDKTPWSIIDKIGKAGKATDFFKIGEERAITVENENIIIQIADFSHDILTSGGNAAYTFCMKDCFKTKHRINDVSTGNRTGWGNSEMYSHINTNIFNKFPSDLKSVIKKTNKQTSEGNGVSTIKTSSDSLWLFSEVEIFGVVKNSYEGEGSEYPIFDIAENRRKKVGNGLNYSIWWTRSPAPDTSSNWCDVTSGGETSLQNVRYEQGVCVGFCV